MLKVAGRGRLNCQNDKLTREKVRLNCSRALAGSTVSTTLQGTVSYTGRWILSKLIGSLPTDKWKVKC